MKTTLSVVFLAAALTWPCVGQEPNKTEVPPVPAIPPEKAAVMANDRSYEAAFAKGDAKALGDFYAEDAEYTDDEGRVYSGRAAIEENIRSGFRGRKGAKLAIAVDSVRALSPEVVLEKGSTKVTDQGGETSDALYTAIHVKKDGKWKISQLVESPVPDPTPNDRLTELAWLVGDWEEADKAGDLTVRSQFSWARGGNYLTRNVTVKRAGNTALEGWQIIGWDPVENRIRVWTFDGEGGFAEGYFTRNGERWLLRETGVAPDGTRTSADNTMNKLSKDRFSWESKNRTLDGEPQPDISRIEINRVKGD